MKQFSLLSLLVLSSFCASAGEGLAGLKSLTTPRGYSGATDIDRVCFFSNIGGFYAGTQTTAGSTTLNGKGLGLQIDFGAKVPLRTGNSRANNILSFSLAYILYGSKGSYNDAAMITHDFKNNFTAAGLPISYTSIHNGRGDVGFYWQGGITISYLGTVTDKDNEKRTGSYNQLGVSPFVGAGITVDYEISKGPYAGRVNSMIGPVVSYCATNMIAASGASMHSYFIGLQMTSLRLGR